MVLALLVSDIHLSSTVPLSRSSEPDWYEAQKRILVQVKELQREYDVPIICAGDIFDRWNSSPELINFAIKHLPKLYAIPGQHDLPYHDVRLLEKSAFWTLVCEGTIEYLQSPRKFRGFTVFPFGWDEKLLPCPGGEGITLLLVHRYVWVRGKGYPNAPEENRIANWKNILNTYDVAVFGDNHKRFLLEKRFLNCGCLIPRKLDEREQTPSVGLLHDDGTIGLHLLDCSQDLWSDRSDQLHSFVLSLDDLDATTPDFRTALKCYLEKHRIGSGISDWIWRAVDG